jgi:hypothetical protein
LWTDIQLRYDNNNTTMQQTLIRFGPLKQITEKNEIGFLAAFIQTGLIDEYRATLHHLYHFSTNPEHAFLLRNRLEGRALEDNPDFSIRYRSMFRYQTALKGNHSLVIWDEPFLNLTRDDWTGNRLVERNSFFLGPRISFHDSHLEVGYMNQFIPRDNVDIYEHIITMYFFY